MTREQIKDRYSSDCKWREAWHKLSVTAEPGRLQVRQEQIENRANLANNRIARLMRYYDSLSA